MDYWSITSQEVLERISRHCPEALSIYLQCLNRADAQGHVHFSKTAIEVDMSEDWLPFLRSIKKLAKENLLEWQPIDNGLSITLADIHHDD